MQKSKLQFKSQNEITEFFKCLGEIWRDVAAIEFLMRCAIARKDKEIKKFPKPPYTKGRIYKDYPKSFSIIYFSEVANEFNKYFPNISISQELIDLRNAIAHGVIADVNNSGFDQLIKFREIKNKELKIEFSITLEISRLAQIRQSLKELRIDIMKEIDDKKYEPKQ